MAVNVNTHSYIFMCFKEISIKQTYIYFCCRCCEFSM